MAAVGLASIVVGIIVLARPALSVDSLLLVLAGAVALNSVRPVIAGGHRLSVPEETWRVPRWGQRLFHSLGLLGIGAVALGMAVAVALFPTRVATAAVPLLGFALAAQGASRILEGVGANVPRWVRGTSIVTGAVIVVLVLATFTFETPAILGFAILVGVVLLVNGIETVVAALRPTDPRQIVLLKLLLFASFYGLVMINWIDLFDKSVPAYGVWLVLVYFAPFAVLIVFEGLESWPLATSLGLLVSLYNDVGYYFVGNLLFGMNQPLLPWIQGQLGIDGSQLVTVFEAGAFQINVTSWMMGLSIYLRAAVVAIILYYWWQHPTRLVARTSPEPGPSPSVTSSVR